MGYYGGGSGAGIGGNTGSLDNRLLRSDGADGQTLQSSGIVVDDNDRLGVGVDLPDRAIHLGLGKALRGTIQVISDNSEITLDMATGNFFMLTIEGNRVMNAPAGIQPGQSGIIHICQGTGGNNLLGWDEVWHFPGGAAPTLSTGEGAVDIFAYFVSAVDSIDVVFSSKGSN